MSEEETAMKRGEDEIGEIDKTKKLVERAFRKKTGINERLLCMRLIQATFATDSKKIIDNTTAAAAMVEASNPKVEGLDFEKMRVIKAVSDDFLKVYQYTYKVEHKYRSSDYVAQFPVPWSINITEKVYEKYIEPWDTPNTRFIDAAIKLHRKPLGKLRHEGPSSSFLKDIRGCKNLLATVDIKDRDKEEQKWIGKKCPHCGEKIGKDDVWVEVGNFVVGESKWSFFIEKTHYLTLFGVKILHTAFKNWAENECLKAITIMGTLVSQNIYDDVLKQLIKTGQEEPEENQRRK